MPDFRLLVIEDESDIAKLVCRVAEELQFDTRIACEANEILPLLDTFRPHVIVLDILMPEMDGFEVLNLLHQRHSDSRVMVLSGQDYYRTMACRMGEAFQLMVVGGLSKPFRVNELRLALQEILASLPIQLATHPIGTAA